MAFLLCISSAPYAIHRARLVHRSFFIVGGICSRASWETCWLRVENVDIVSSLWCHSLNDFFNFMKIFAQFFSSRCQNGFAHNGNARANDFPLIFVLFPALFPSVPHSYKCTLPDGFGYTSNGSTQTAVMKTSFTWKFEFERNSQRTRELHVTVKLIRFDDLLVVIVIGPSHQSHSFDGHCWIAGHCYCVPVSLYGVGVVHECDCRALHFLSFAAMWLI